jgi:hypothetical protein
MTVEPEKGAAYGGAAGPPEWDSQPMTNDSLPSPRPWKGCAHVEGIDPGCPCGYRGDVVSVPADQVVLQLGVGPDHPDGRDEGSGWKSIPRPDLETGYANGRLIVEAVNNYDRLRAIEAAARTVREAHDGGVGVWVSGALAEDYIAAMDALRAALQAADSTEAGPPDVLEGGAER